jgi:hypothetical protein
LHQIHDPSQLNDPSQRLLSIQEIPMLND